MSNGYVPLVIFGSWAFDYLTLGCFSSITSLEFANRLTKRFEQEGINSPLVTCKRMQYTGQELNGFFYGEAVQRGEYHYMMDIKGGWADMAFRVARDMVREGHVLSCSRIDMQGTVQGEVSIQRIYEGIEGKKWRWRGRELVHRFHIGSDGLNSVEFGAKKSDIRSIVYIKELPVEGRGTRHELRFYGHQAREVFIRSCFVSNYQSYIKELTYSRLKKFPERFEDMMRGFLDLIPTKGMEIDGHRFKVDRSEEGRLEWWLTAVEPATYSLLSGQYRDVIAERISNMLQFATAKGYPVDNARESP